MGLVNRFSRSLVIADGELQSDEGGK